MTPEGREPKFYLGTGINEPSRIFSLIYFLIVIAWGYLFNLYWMSMCWCAQETACVCMCRLTPHVCPGISSAIKVDIATEQAKGYPFFLPFPDLVSISEDERCACTLQRSNCPLIEMTKSIDVLQPVPGWGAWEWWQVCIYVSFALLKPEVGMEVTSSKHHQKGLRLDHDTAQFIAAMHCGLTEVPCQGLPHLHHETPEGSPGDPQGTADACLVSVTLSQKGIWWQC